jgi:hypothetical protein
MGIAKFHAAQILYDASQNVKSEEHGGAHYAVP